MMDPLDHLSAPTKLAIDAASVLTTVGALAAYLPQLSAAASFLWFCLRVWETETVKGWTGRKG